MKLAVAFLFAMVAVAYVSARPEDGGYTSKFDDIDVDSILNSDRLLTNYKKCLLNKGRCTPEGAELKKVLPDAIATECSKCSEKQKEVSKKVIKFLVEKKPDVWNELVAEYDPDGKYRTKYEKVAKDAGIQV